MKLSRTRRITFNLGNFENYIIDATVEVDVAEPVDIAKSSTQMNDALDGLLFEELKLVEELTGNRDSAIFEHPLITTKDESK